MSDADFADMYDSARANLPNKNHWAVFMASEGIYRAPIDTLKKMGYKMFNRLRATVDMVPSADNSIKIPAKLIELVFRKTGKPTRIYPAIQMIIPETVKGKDIQDLLPESAIQAVINNVWIPHVKGKPFVGEETEHVHLC